MALLPVQSEFILFKLRLLPSNYRNTFQTFISDKYQMVFTQFSHVFRFRYLLDLFMNHMNQTIETFICLSHSFSCAFKTQLLPKKLSKRSKLTVFVLVGVCQTYKIYQCKCGVNTHYHKSQLFWVDVNLKGLCLVLTQIARYG